MKTLPDKKSGFYEIRTEMLFSLTYREWQVLILLTQDLRNAEIASQLFVKTKTIEVYINRIGSKLDISGRDTLSRYARKHDTKLMEVYSRYY